MFAKFTLTMITFIMLTMLAGCGSTTPSTPGSNAGPDNSQINPSGTYDAAIANEYQMLPIISGKVANLKLDASAVGTTQQLKKGEVMSITLESNPSTGFSWFAALSNADVLVQMGEPEYQAPTSNATTPVLGAAGTQTYFFQAADTGTVTITLDYNRGWETTVAPEKTITITVEVK
jgi:inhibitor of cysteine peptidase